MNIVNGFDHNFELPTVSRRKVDVEKLEEILVFEKKANETNSTGKKEKEIDLRFILNDHSLKELLFLITSRGNSSSIEKLVELLKKERDLLLRLKG
jgi:hypothetical protein